MNNIDLLTGIAVIIDDEIDDKRANISALISQIKKRKMPFITYKDLPDISVIKHFDGISFILLAWVLRAEVTTKSITEGVTIPDSLKNSYVKENINFIKKLRESCFIPIFIFTDAGEATVIKALKNEDLYQEEKPNYIFVKSKSDLKDHNKLFRVIEKWILSNPSVYVLKAWGKAYQASKNKLFHDFYRLSPFWPNILWKSFFDDGVNMSLELGEVITRNLYTRMIPFEFNNNILNKDTEKASSEEIRKVMEGERYIEEDCLHKDTISSGDLFKISGKIYVNIRPDCDCIPRGNNVDEADVILYLLKGSKLNAEKEKKAFNNECGNFKETTDQCIVFSMLGGCTYDFRFKELKLEGWSKIKSKRIGRLLPPYITRIQQRYALYLQRQGLMRIPERAIK